MISHSWHLLSLPDALSSFKERPTALVFDLDPGSPVTIIECIPVAVCLKEIFDACKLKVFAKTSGSKGLQLYVPLNRPVTYEQTKPFAQALAKDRKSTSLKSSH